MIYVNYICNGCGLYSSYNGKNEKQLNVLEIDITHYLIFTSAFIPKEPKLRLHFCDECLDKINKGSVAVKTFGDTESLRSQLVNLQKELDRVKDEFQGFKSKVSTLLTPLK